MQNRTERDKKEVNTNVILETFFPAKFKTLSQFCVACILVGVGEW